MQMKYSCKMRKNNQLNRAEAFPVVWDGMTDEQKQRIRMRLIVEIGINEVTLYRWREGRSVPRLPFYRSTAARIVSEVTGRQMSAADLFPLDK